MVENSNVLIIEDELITAQTIEELLQAEDFFVMGTAKDAATALLICNQASRPPAVIICDINIRGNVKGTELAGQLKELYDCEVIFLTAYSDQKTLQEAFAKDPVMYVVKPFTDKQLLVALQMAFHKIYQKEKQVAQLPLDLTDREREIAFLVAQGNSSKQVARQLLISEETVKTHRRKMLQKNRSSVHSFSHLVYLLSR